MASPALHPQEVVRFSKALSYILRHGAHKEGLAIRDDGYIAVEDLLKRPKLKNLDLDTLKHIVETNDKKRFKLIQEEGGGYFIKANQGHSIQGVEKIEMTPITSASEAPIMVHGTFLKLWATIEKTGLSKMRRTHIHCAAGLPGESGVISGMGKGRNLYIYLDVAKMLKDHIAIVRSENGVLLTAGIDGIVPTKYFAKVVTKDGVTLYPK